MRTPRKRTVNLVIVVSAIATAVFAADAQAATIHACVKPKGGATRIVATKAKCRPGEQRMSWNTAGARGPAGASGKNGASGANGAQGSAGSPGAGVASTLFAATSHEPLTLALGETQVLTKTLPPGSYRVSGHILLFAESSKAAVTQLLCEIADQPGTTGGGESTFLDVGQLELALAQTEPSNFVLATPYALEGVLTSGVTSTLSIGCTNFTSISSKAVTSQLLALSVGTVL